MSTMPAVIVKKGGMFSALFHGLFGFLTAIVVCASALGFYALHVADSWASDVLGLVDTTIDGLPQWQQALPPMLAEAIDDRRVPEYREQIEVSVETAPAPYDPARDVTVIRVENLGSETISVLAFNVTLENEDGVPIDDYRVYAATPFAIDEHEWRGPLLPGAVQRFTTCSRGHERGLRATASVAELRVWNPPMESAVPEPEVVTEPGEAVAELP